MASIQQAKELAASVLRVSPKAVFNFIGKPGMGKSAAALQLADELDIPADRVGMFNLTHFETTDFTGVPEIDDISADRDGSARTTVFRPTDILYKFRKGTGPGLIILEELAQSGTDMQTWAAGFILDRKTPTFELDPQVRIVTTSNRVEDRAGAKQLLSHLADRMYNVPVDTSLDDWCIHAMEIGLDPMGIAFLRLRPQLLNDFDPARMSNPTQRSWTKLFQEVPSTLPTDLYLLAAEAKVGEAAAAEWVAARDMMLKMPSVDSIRLNPEGVEIPSEPAVKYAVATALSMTTKPEAFERDMKYISRMPKEFQMVYVTDALRMHPGLQQTKDFITWAIANEDIFMSSN